MITSLAQFIVGFLHKNKTIESSRLDIYIYGFEIAISNIITFVIAIIMGLLFSQFIEGIIYIVVFSIMRKYCGGYHAETYLKCDSIFSLCTLVLMIILKVVDYYPIYIHIIISFLTIGSVLWLAPVENKYKPLTIDEQKKHKIIAVFYGTIFMMISTFLYFYFFKYHAVIDITLLIVSISMIIEFVMKEGVKHENYEKEHS